MKPATLDHLVLTTNDLAATLAFYAGFLGMEHVEKDGRHALLFGPHKINIHTRAGEFQPAALAPTPGSLDLCLEVQDTLEQVLAEAEHHGITPLTGIVPRNGARGPMQSVYFRDPDGNLVELCHYV